MSAFWKIADNYGKVFESPLRSIGIAEAISFNGPLHKLQWQIFSYTREKACPSVIFLRVKSLLAVRTYVGIAEPLLLTRRR